MIFNAHPTLYWGKQSYGGAGKCSTSRRIARRRRYCAASRRVFGHSFDTTGLFGVARECARHRRDVAFPHWLTIPSRRIRWRLRGAGTSSSCGCSSSTVSRMWSGRLRRGTCRAIWRRRAATSVRSAIDQGSRAVQAREAAKPRRSYNVLQKLTYLSVIFVWLPLVILMGFAMSPSLNALLPGWVDRLRRAAVGAHAALRCGARARGVHCAARVSGDHHGPVEQHAIDVQRALSNRSGALPEESMSDWSNGRSRRASCECRSRRIVGCGRGRLRQNRRHAVVLGTVAKPAKR